jgi:putative nucleotidyltransferase with HDIG domain
MSSSQRSASLLTKPTSGPAMSALYLDPRRASSGGTEEMLSRRTELVLRELEQLPTLPAVATKLLQMGSNDDVDVREIVRVIESDPSVTARLLGLCKKSAYRTRNPITTVEMAVVMLGLEAVRSLVLSVEIFDWTKNVHADRRSEGGGAAEQRTARGRASTKPGTTERGEPKASFNRVGFWQHSIAVACCCDLIAREHPDLDFHAEEAFVCGLVHDIGKMALDLVLPRAYARVIELAETRQGDIADFERPIVGLDHHGAGATIADHWGLPDMLRDAIAWHHSSIADLPEGVNKRMVVLVQLADLICRKLTLGWSGNFSGAGDEKTLCLAANLHHDRVMGVVPKLYEAASSRMKDLGLGEEPSQALLVESILKANQRLGKTNQDLIQANLALEAAQRELSEARALARLGQMTAGAAHEMNNPLAVISGRSQALLGRLRDDDDRSAARAIVNASMKLTDLITRLNRIATPPTAQPVVVDLKVLLEQIIRRAKDKHGERVQARGDKLSVIGVKLTLPEQMHPARLDPELLSDALGEIIINALESGPRGRIEVRADVDRHDDRLMIQVNDDGVGMSELALSHALDPFFSEKPAGRQTGLGLALAHRLIASCGGEIDLQSRPGKGTSATVYLTHWRAGKDARIDVVTRNSAAT